LVVIHFSKEDSEKNHRKHELQEMCLDMFDKCESKGYPCTKKVEGKGTMCDICQRNCLNEDPYRFDQCRQCGFR
jgi:hypothetical protein